MSSPGPVFALFVKPWKALSIPRLAEHVKNLGFTWIELPVRPGFPCEPETIETSLPAAVAQLAGQGVRVLNVTVALPLTDERLYAASVKAGIRMNRVIFEHGENENYWQAEKRARQKLDAAMPFCEQYGFQIGVQNHYGHSLPVNAMGLYHLVKDYDPKYVGAIWDPAHNALSGEEPEPALDMVSSHLCVVNLKNACWQRVNGTRTSADERGEIPTFENPSQESAFFRVHPRPIQNGNEVEVAEWRVEWTSGRQGRASWRHVAAKLKQMDYQGPVCLSAEYSAEGEVDRLIVEDLAFARECFAHAP